MHRGSQFSWGRVAGLAVAVLALVAFGVEPAKAATASTWLAAEGGSVAARPVASVCVIKALFALEDVRKCFRRSHASGGAGGRSGASERQAQAILVESSGPTPPPGGGDDPEKGRGG